MDLIFQPQGKPYTTRQLPNGYNVDFYHRSIQDTETAAFILEFSQFVETMPQLKIPDIWVIQKGKERVWGLVAEKENPDGCVTRLLENWKTIEDRLVA